MCKDDPNVNEPLLYSCIKYWACHDGYPRLQTCPAMQIFDKVSKRCIATPTADCDIPATPPSPGGIGSRPKGSSGNSRGACVPVGQYGSCIKYWACYDGYLRLETCPAMQVFDKVSKRCIATPTADCDIPATPPSTGGIGSGLRGSSGNSRGN
jgi:hypothetical protein